MGRTPFRASPRSLFVAAFAALLVVNALGWVLGWAAYGRSQTPVHAGAPSTSAAIEPARVRLQAALPTQDVEGTDRLIVVLERPVRPHLTEAAEPRPEALPELLDPPFTIQPPLAGSWEWDGRDRLVYQLEEPIGACREVEMTPTGALERYLGEAVSGDFVARWESAPLRPVRLRTQRVTDHSVFAELWLNARLEPEDLLAGLSVRQPDRDGPLSVALAMGEEQGAETRARSRSRMQLAGSAVDRRAFRYLIAIDRPDRDATHLEVSLDHPWVRLGSKKTAEDLPAKSGLSWLLEVPMRFSLMSKDAEVSSTSRRASVELHFSESLDSGQPTPTVAVRPRVEPLSVRMSGKTLVLEGLFEAGATYGITLPENLLSQDGETLVQPERFEIEIPKRRPHLTIPHWRGTLSPLGHLALELESTAVAAVEVSAQRVLPGNLVEHVRGESRRFTSSEVLSETYPLPQSPDGEPVTRHALDLKALLSEEDRSIAGVYHVRVRSTENRWTQDYATVRITDLGATVKRDADGLHVWVRSIATGEPIGGAALTAQSVKDQTLGLGQTNAQGYGLIPCPADGARASAEDSDREPFLVLVEHGADTSYLELQSSRWDVPRSVAEGRERPRVADAFVYTERSLYRPGDAVYLTGIARTPTGIVFARPLDLEITRPDGAVMHEQGVTPDPGQGLFHASFTTSEDARTGTWKISVRDPATGAVVGRARFGVEAFLPARMALSSASHFELAKASEPDGSEQNSAPSTSVQARSLAGTSVEGFAADVATRWTPLRFRSARFPLFSFEREEDDRYAQSASATAVLDDAGAARVDLPGYGEFALARRGLWRATSTWTVTEPGSRSATARSVVRVDTSDEHRGLRIDQRAGLPADAVESVEGAGLRVVRVGEPWVAVAVCLSAHDELEASEEDRALFAVLERTDRRWELDQGSQRPRWTLRTERVAVAQSAMLPDGAGTYRLEIVCPTAGEYRLTLRGQDELPPVVLRFHASEDPASFRPELVGEDVQLTLETQSAVPGSTVAVHIDSPFDGTALVTAEDHRLRWQQQVEVRDGRASVSMPVPGDVRGGLVVSCQVTRPLDAQARTWRPHRAYGWARVATLHASHERAVSIDAPKRVRPGDVATVTVRAGATSNSSRAAVHLWAVDEGLRLAGAHRLPQPFEHFLGARSFTGAATDSWFTLLPDLDLPGVTSRIGGDSGLAREARRRAPERVHVVPGVVWNEAVLLGEDGAARFELRVPEFTGELTWMAVVVDRDEYGAAEARTTLAGELPLALGLPRFVAPGDQFRLKVAFENATEESATATPKLALSGAANVLDAPEDLPITLASGERHVAWYLVEAADSGRITGEAWLEGRFADGRPVDERARIDLPVRSGSPLVTRSHTFTFDAAEERDATLPLGELLGLDPSAREECELRLSAEPGLDLLPAGAYLTDYPHGCAEQTASRIFASLSLVGLRARGDDAKRAWQGANDRVVRGFVRLAGMQTEDGGIGYWPGDSSPSAWASVYVAEVIGAAKELGFAAPARLADGLVGYLDARLRSVKDPGERARLVWATAALGSRHDGWIRRLEEQSRDLDGPARASLAAALATLGESERALALLDGTAAPDDSPEDSEERSARRDYLGSSVRQTALELRTLIAIDPHHPGVQARVQRLEAERAAESGRWRNTIDNAAALAALALYAQSLPVEDADWTVAVNLGNDALSVTAASLSGSPWRAQIPAGVEELAFEALGTGPVFASVRGTGRADQNFGEIDRGLVCRRTFFDGSGQPLDPRAVRHGDLVFVEVELGTDGRSAVHDVAIVDPLPGGLEIETPELLDRFPWQKMTGSRTAAPNFVRSGRPDRVEFLDDRVLIYSTARPEAAPFRYAARAVAPGVFEWSPVQAEAMYDPLVSSVGEAACRLEVKR